MLSQPRRSSRTLLWGALFGILLALLVVVEHLFEARLVRAAALGVARPGLSLLVPVLFYVLGLLCFFLAGLLATRRTRLLSSGLFAGMIAGLLAAVVGLILALHSASVADQAVRHAAIAPRLQAALRSGIAGAVLRAVFAAISTPLVGAGVGALGGLAGRGASAAAPPTTPFPYASGSAPSASHGFAPATPRIPEELRYGPATPQTYIQGNDNPTVQTLRHE